MKRVVRTSQGYVEINYSGKGWGDVEVFDSDGWSLEGRVWGMKGYWSLPAGAIEACTTLPKDEIEQITVETHDQFLARGGDVVAYETTKWGRFGVMAMIIAGAFAVVGVIALVVLLIGAVT